MTNSADGANSGLEVLVEVVLEAIVEVLTPRVVGGVLRTRPMPAFLKKFRDIGVQ